MTYARDAHGEAPFTYRATNRDGRAEVGTIECRSGRVAGTVQSFYKRRYRTLSVMDGDIEVGGICRNDDTGRRTWWAEVDR